MGKKNSSAKERVRSIIKRLKKAYPKTTTALRWRDPFQLLVATILSAQCTDERVNAVTKELFKRYRTPKDLARASREELEELIRPTGFFRNKAKALQGAAAKLVEEFGGKVPDSLEELTRLPGVARKTANVVLGTCFGIPAGVVVDTHVRRVAGRLGLTSERDPVKIERDLMELVPESEWIGFSHRLIWLGREVCRARKPRCEECVLADLCPSAEKK